MAGVSLAGSSIATLSRIPRCVPTHTRACTPPPLDSRIPEERDETGQAQRARRGRAYWDGRVREELNEKKKEEKKKVEGPGERAAVDKEGGRETKRTSGVE